MKLVQSCKILCTKTYSEKELNDFAEKIQDEYRINMIVDNLPVATKYFVETVNAQGQKSYSANYEKGFPLGFMGSEMVPGTEEGTAYVNNHHRLILYTHEDANSFEGLRIVKFEVEPFSVKHTMEGKWDDVSTRLTSCTPLHKVHHGQTPQKVSKVQPGDETIIWTYDVQWEKSDVRWASRWDIYLRMTDPQIHWFSIINSMAIAFFLSAMVAMIMMRILHRDFMRYNEEVDEEEAQEETGWKLVHSDVFRPPAFARALCVLVGTGYQLLLMSIVTLVFAVLGFLSPANRGGLMTALLLLFVFMGSVAGYVSSRMYQYFQFTDWKRNSFWTSIFFPGVSFSVFFVLNLAVWGEKSSGAVPFTTLISLLVLWFGISVPLVYLGSYFAWKKEAITPPIGFNDIPRQVPPQHWLMQPLVTSLLAGLLPFGAGFIEIFFMMSSIWHHEFYYMFGFLFIVFIILVVTCAEVAIVLCYFHLCAEDYNWWWRSFNTAGSASLYVFLYSAMYYSGKMHVVKVVSTMLYFGYMGLVSFAFYIMTGTVGITACWLFVRKIYSSIKVD